MNNDNKVETAIAGLNCWGSYATECCIKFVCLCDLSQYAPIKRCF